MGMGLGNPFHEDGAESEEGRCVLGSGLGLDLGLGLGVGGATS